MNEVFDQVINSLESRFNTNSAEFSKSSEDFAVGKSGDVKNIVAFYKEDFNAGSNF